MAKDAVIRVSGLSKSYSGRKALDGVSLEIGKGELFGLLGPNGAGKTTMIRAMTGQLKPDSGSVTVGGVDVLKDPVGARKIVGIVPEQETPPSFLTASEYLRFVCMIRKLGDVEKRCARWFDYLAFGEERDVLCKNLSRGTRQKLMISQAFIHEPEIAFIDEPLINLDPVMQERVKDHLKRFVRGGGTLFLSTHVLAIAEEICTRIAIIDKGRLIHDGPVSGLRRKKKHLDELFLSLVKE